MNVVFRVDASVEMGTGHMMRCLTLADALVQRGARCRFVCRPQVGDRADLVRRRGHQVHELPRLSARTAQSSQPNVGLAHAAWLGITQEEDAVDCERVLEQAGAVDWLVVDHYGIDAQWERWARKRSRRLLVLDDLADRAHECDLLLDQNLGRERRDYEAHVGHGERLLLGPMYALLGPEFAQLRRIRQSAGPRPALRHLLIAMGGVDHLDATGLALSALANSRLPTLEHITVILGAHAPSLQSVRQQADRMPWPTEVLVDVPNMGQHMLDADLCIGSAGVTAWERCCLGLPSLIVVLADNQRPGAVALAKAGAARLLGPWTAITDRLANELEAMSPDQCKVMSQRAAAITDGLGCNRVLAAMESFDA